MGAGGPGRTWAPAVPLTTLELLLAHPAGGLGQQPQMAADRFADGHFRLAPLSGDQGHGDFGDTVAAGQGADHQLRHRREAVRFKAHVIDHLAAVTAEQGSEGIDRRACDGAVTPGDAPAEDEAVEPTLGVLVVGMPGGGGDYIGALPKEFNETRQGFGGIGAVRIDRADVLDVARKITETGSDRGAEAEIAFVMADTGPGETEGGRVKERSGTVGAAVIDEEDFPGFRLRVDERREAVENPGYRLLLIEAGDNDADFLANGWRIGIPGHKSTSTRMTPLLVLNRQKGPGSRGWRGSIFRTPA